jgi:DNA polymerase-3 subunit alpha
VSAQADFVHLHVHSEYSLLDGLSGVEDLVSEAQRQGMKALALTDHGALYGAIDFYAAAKDADIKPIIGVEAYVAPRGMTDRESQDRNYFHLVLLARDHEGYRNLLQLVTRANLEGYYYKPRIDRELLTQHHKGLIALSGCYSGEPSRAILADDEAGARAAAAWYAELFGRGNYYLELQDHGNEDDHKVNRGLIALGRELGLPLVATNDLHYARQPQADAHDMLLCIQTNSTLEDPKRMRMQPSEFYLKSPQQMAHLFAEVPEAVRNTLEIAERCHLKLGFDRLNFPEPRHRIPEGMSSEDYLAALCREALPLRYRPVTPEVEERLEYELGIIQKTGFAPYMLFVWDFVDWARRQGILCGPRGSAAGSIVLYCLGISQIDPLTYGLTFERFLNPERIQMPDIDMDFADDRRDEVIEYVVGRYGRDRVAQIITFGRLLARAAIRDVGRCLSYPLSEIDRVAKLIPAIPGHNLNIERSLQEVKELQQLYESQPSVKRLIDAAKSVEGVARHAGTHAAGVVVSGDPLVNHVPLQKSSKGEHVMTQYHMKVLEKIGLLKMDFLGLANLTMLAAARRLVEETRGLSLDLDSLPLDDRRTYEALAHGETVTVFQLEGPGMTRYLKELRPTSIDHLAAMVALYRPGPMAHIPAYIARREGREPVQFADPSLEPILSDTYGIIVYQDQVLQVVRKVAGYSLGQADILRRAMGKKLPDEMKKERANFLAGAKKQGYSQEVASRLWEYIEPFAGYAFNRAHAYCYAFVAYQTAYLKANFPVEWMAAVLTTEALNAERVVAVVGESRRMGIPLLPPDVNRSRPRFSVERLSEPGASGSGPGAGGQGPGSDAATGRHGEAANSTSHPDSGGRPSAVGGPLPGPELCIRYGLAAIKNVGEGAVQLLVEERERNGPYTSLEDLCRRVDLKTINKRVLESLIKAGALDQFGRREQLIAGLDQAMSAGQQLQRAQSQGQTSLFDMFSTLPSPPPLPLGEGKGEGIAGTGAGVQDEVLPGSASFTSLPTVPPITRQQRLAWEKEVLGQFLSDHPFQEASRWLSGRVTSNSSQLGPELTNQKVTMAGAIAGVRRLNTKKGETMVVAEVADLHGSFEVVAFPRTYQRTAELWQEDRIVVIEGKVDSRDDRHQIICDGVEAWEPPPVGTHPPSPGTGGPSDPVETLGQTDPLPPADPPAANGAHQGNGNAHSNGAAARNGYHHSETTALSDPPPPDAPYEPGAVAANGRPDLVRAAQPTSDPFFAASDLDDEDDVPYAGRPSGLASAALRAPLSTAPATAVTPSTSPSGTPRLVVTLARSGDAARDIQQLEALHRLLEAESGETPYEVFLAGKGRRVRISPEASTRLTPELEQALRDLVGPDRVQVLGGA